MKNVSGAIKFVAGSVFFFLLGTLSAYADAGLGDVAKNITGNLANIANLITAGSYIAGLGLAVAAIVKFKAHKENPTQVPLSQPIVFLFVGAALIFAPSVFKTTGGTMFSSGTVAGVSGVTGFGAKKAGANT